MSEKEDVQLDFSADAISWLDTYIHQHYNTLSEDDKTVLCEKFGAFVGETIRRNYGGQWVQANENNWMIVFDDQAKTEPFEMVSATLDRRSSLTSLYQQIPELFDNNAIRN
jgi:hypothetical protein